MTAHVYPYTLQAKCMPSRIKYIGVSFMEIIYELKEALEFTFIQRALLVGVFVGLSCALLGYFLVLKKIFSYRRRLIPCRFCDHFTGFTSWTIPHLFFTASYYACYPLPFYIFQRKLKCTVILP